ncbi:MAG: hypothetical protein JKP98_19855 [Rhodobacteraceae bacterium]|nr:hypothetical protein [Paracoccaceae bacterium]
MTNILLAGQAVLDFIFEVEELPTKPEKYRAGAAQIIGGGCAANAAVAVERLGGQAFIATRVGGDPVGQTIADGLAPRASTSTTCSAPMMAIRAIRRFRSTAMATARSSICAAPGWAIRWTGRCPSGSTPCLPIPDGRPARPRR